MKEMMMSIYNRPIGQKDLDYIASYMDDELREKVHSELAPCKPSEFISRYIELEPEFEEILEQEFDFCFAPFEVLTSDDKKRAILVNDEDIIVDAIGLDNVLGNCGSALAETEELYENIEEISYQWKYDR